MRYCQQLKHKPEKGFQMVESSVALIEDVPRGQFRVIGTGPGERSYVLRDCGTSEEACALADGSNRGRVETSDDTFRAYDDRGNCLTP